jgi:hypothetical protein
MNSKSDLEMDGKAEHQECGTALQASQNDKLTRRLLLKLDTRYVCIYSSGNIMVYSSH